MNALGPPLDHAAILAGLPGAGKPAQSKKPDLALLREDRAKIVLIRTGDAHARERSWCEIEAVVDPYHAIDFGGVGSGTADRTAILDAIDKHRERAADLILQSMRTDVGLRG